MFVLLGATDEVIFNVANDRVIVCCQQEVDFHALARIGVGEDLCHADAIGLVGDLGSRSGQVLLVMGVLDVSEKAVLVAEPSAGAFGVDLA